MHTRISQVAATLALIGLFVYDFTAPAIAEPPADFAIAREIRVRQEFRSLPLEARAVVVYDLGAEREIFQRNADEVVALASLTKIMTAEVASDALAPTAVIEISKEDIRTEGDNGLFGQERWIFRDLMDLTLTASSNDGANAIASAVEGLSRNDAIPDHPSFVERMNARAQALGLASMTFKNPTGLDAGERAGGYASARDVVRLVSHMLRTAPEVLGATTRTTLGLVSLSGKTHTVQNTNAMTSTIPRLIAAKTGYTDLAGGNLVVAYDAELLRPFIIVVLGSSYDGRFTDMELLMLVVRRLVANDEGIGNQE